MNKVILIWSLIVSGISYSQTDITTDSIEIRTFFPQEYGQKKWKVLFGLDAHRSFFSGKPIKFNGIRLGAEFKGVHRFGLGVYGPKKNLEFTDIPVDYPDAAANAVLRLDVSFTTLFYERVFFKNKHWEVSVPINFGGGQVKAIYQDTLGIFQNTLDIPFSTFGFGTQVKYYFWGWLIPHAAIGYRLTFNTDKEIKQAFNSPYYSFGLSIGIGELYRRIFKKDEGRKIINEKINEGSLDEEDF